MNIIYTVFLGIIQGAAEFLPISSSGHLQLFKAIFDIRAIPLFYDILLHIATLFVILIAMRSPIAAIIRSVFSPPTQDTAASKNIVFAVLISSIPTALIGFFIDRTLLPIPLVGVGICFLLSALVLFSSNFSRLRHTKISFYHAVLIGLVHGCTVLPGISRAGITIACILLLGYSGRTAVQLSFISAIPVMLGALVLKLRDFSTLQSLLTPVEIGAGCLAAFIVGFVSYKFLRTLVERQKLHYFSAYLVVVGIGSILYSYFT